MHFTKMHGLGNDYLYVYGEVPADIAELSQRLSDRHFGAGSDGMIYISPSGTADFRMRIFNADGSEAKMCGNGIRCVGKYVYDKGYTDSLDRIAFQAESALLAGSPGRCLELNHPVFDYSRHRSRNLLPAGSQCQHTKACQE